MPHLEHLKTDIIIYHVWSMLGPTCYIYWYTSAVTPPPPPWNTELGTLSEHCLVLPVLYYILEDAVNSPIPFYTFQNAFPYKDYQIVLAGLSYLVH